MIRAVIAEHTGQEPPPREAPPRIAALGTVNLTQAGHAPDVLQKHSQLLLLHSAVSKSSSLNLQWEYPARQRLPPCIRIAISYQAPCTVRDQVCFTQLSVCCCFLHPPRWDAANPKPCFENAAAPPWTLRDCCQTMSRSQRG